MKDNKHYHFIGVGGIGMGALATLLLAKGKRVSGSDIRENQITMTLASQGANIYKGHNASYVDGADVVVYSSAIKKGNPEYQRAAENKQVLMRRAELLAELMKQHTGITIAGAHGKTTTSSMVSTLLTHAGLEPTTAVGGIVNQTSTNAKLGQGKYFVAEVDESDGSFQNFSPDYSIITNIDIEHLDYYESWENIQKAYEHFMQKTVEDGRIILFGDDEILMEVARLSGRDFLTFGFSEHNNIRAENIRYEGFRSQFDCILNGECLGTVTLQLPGRHNISNALAAIFLGLELGVAFDNLVEGLRHFEGVQRRFQILGCVNDITIVDDYAHHPTELNSTLQAAQLIGKNRMVTVFQPHRYTRLQALFDEFVSSFVASDYVIITDIYAASENPIEGVTSSHLVEKIKEITDKPVVYCPRNELTSYLLQELQTGDFVLTLGAGDITQVAKDLYKQLSSKSTKLSSGDDVFVDNLLHKYGRIGVIMGGYSSEREISLKSGEAVFKALENTGCEVVKINLVEREEEKIKEVIRKANIDLAFIALHGELGEDGIIQSILEEQKILYTGTGVQANRIAISKTRTQGLLQNNDILVPAFVIRHKNDLIDLDDIFQKVGPFPYVVKPSCEGSSIGVEIVTNEQELVQAVEMDFQYGNEVMIEQYIKGREFTVSILDNTPLSVVEICASKKFFDFDAKYKKGLTEYIVPAKISDELTKQMQDISLKVFSIMGAQDFARVDFMLSEEGLPYVLELNTIPGFTATSLLPMAAKVEGIGFEELCLKIVKIAYGKKKEIQNTTVSC